MVDVRENDRESSTKRKKRQRSTNAAVAEKEDQVSRMQYEEGIKNINIQYLIAPGSSSLLTLFLSPIPTFVM